MKAITAAQKGQTADGRRIMDVFIIANDTPNPLPTNGSNVIGLKDTDLFAPFSMLFVVGEADAKIYIADEDGMFVAQ